MMDLHITVTTSTGNRKFILTLGENQRLGMLKELITEAIDRLYGKIKVKSIDMAIRLPG